MWYVRYRNNTKYGWRPIKFATFATQTQKKAFQAALELRKSGWKEIHITKKRA